MARPHSEPRYYKSRNGFFVTIKGQLYRLSHGPETARSKKEASRKFYRLLVDSDAGHLQGERTKVADLVDAFLAADRKIQKETTIAAREKHLIPFKRKFGSKTVGTLSPAAVEAWIHGHQRWGRSTRRMCVAACKRVFNWARERKILGRSPLEGLELKAARSRARDTLPTDAQWQQLLDAARPDFADFLRAILKTGCRPGECARVTAADFDPAHGQWILQEHKNDDSGKPRIITLTPDLVETCKRLALTYPEGPLFRRRDRKQWTRERWGRAFRKLRARLRLPKHVVIYHARHTRATEMLRTGTPVGVMCQQLGTSLICASNTYFHATTTPDDMRKRLAASLGENTPTEAPAERKQA